MCGRVGYSQGNPGASRPRLELIDEEYREIARMSGGDRSDSER